MLELITAVGILALEVLLLKNEIPLCIEVDARLRVDVWVVVVVIGSGLVVLTASRTLIASSPRRASCFCPPPRCSGSCRYHSACTQ